MGAALIVRDRKKLWESLLFIALGLALILYSNGLWTSKTEIFMSPYLFPFLIGTFFTLLAVVLLIQSLDFGKAASEEAGPGVRLDWRNVVVVVGFSAAYCVLLPFIHFFPATVIFLFGLLYVLGERRIWLDAVLAIGTTTAVYVSFGLLLSVLLP